MSASNNAIRVMLIEPEPLLRDGIVCVLERHSEVDVVGEMADARYLRQLATRVRPEVLLADSALFSGMASSVQTSEADSPALRVVVILKERHVETLHQRIAGLIGAGVHAFVSMQDRAETVVEAVHAAASRDEIYLSPRVAERLAAPNGRTDGAAEALTRRERDVLERAALGHSNARIADDLGLAPGTVRNHLSAVYAKLEVSARAEAVAWAWRHDLVSVRQRAEAATTEM